MANMTKAQLMAKIAEMVAAKEPAQDALVRALAAVVARGEEGAAMRLEWWQRRVQQLEDAS